MKRVSLALLLAQCLGCSSMHAVTSDANKAVAAGAVLLAIGVALQTDISGIDSPKTGNIRDISGPVNTLHHLSPGTWRNAVRVIRYQ